jgi:putative addiction module component (TIGR02574 family)
MSLNCDEFDALSAWPSGPSPGFCHLPRSLTVAGQKFCHFWATAEFIVRIDPAPGRYTAPMNTHLFGQVQQLPLEEQLELVEALWTSIVERDAVPPLTEAQREELDRRLADHESNPDDVVSWDDVKASALAHIRR